MRFGSLPAKREVPDFVRKRNAEELLLKTLRRQGTAGTEHRKQLQSVQKHADSVAEKLALLVHKKRFSPDDPFVQSFRQLLKSEGITLITYAGEVVTEQLEEDTDIVEWLPAEGNAVEQVIDALEPEIRWRGRVLHRAKLSCRMAEDTEEPPAEAVTAGELPVTVQPELPAEDTKAEEAQDAADSNERAPDTEATQSEDAGVFRRVFRQLARAFRAVTNAEESARNMLDAEFETVPSGDVAPETRDNPPQEESAPEETVSKDTGFFRRVLQRLSGIWNPGEQSGTGQKPESDTAPEAPVTENEPDTSVTENEKGDTEHVNQ